MHQGVIESLLRRLSPRNREDFTEFLAQHRLPYSFNYSDMTLLGYTGALLPSDGFALVPDFSQNSMSCDYLMEVAGLHHVFNDMHVIHEGDTVNFQIDQDNPVDQDALQVICHGQKSATSIGHLELRFIIGFNLIMLLRRSKN